MKRPNILMILIDDMGWCDLTCYGSTFYETPNIDRLAQDGMLFTNAYAACPVCSPSRASILSGKYPARLGLTDWIGANTRGKLIDAPYIDHLPLEEVSLAKALKMQGYDTWHVGKWHLGNEAYYPLNHGFDINIGGSHWGAPVHGYFSPYQLQNLTDGPIGEYLTDRLTDEAIALIENSDDTPFYLNLCHYAVHHPIQAPEVLIEKYRQKRIALGLDKEVEFVEGEFFPCEHKKDIRVIRRQIQSDPAYAAMIENLDTNIGRLLDCLSKTGKLKDTIILFTSDNGGLATSEGSPTSNAPLSEGKGWMYEGGVREPLIVHWPEHIRPGSICDIPVTSTDFYPTLLEAIGAPPMPHQHVDGVSFFPALQGEKYKRQPMFWHYPHYGNQGGTPGSSVRDGDYKLIHFYEDDSYELYNLYGDASEAHNLIHDLPELAEALKSTLKKWSLEVQARKPLENPFYTSWSARGTGHH